MEILSIIILILLSLVGYSAGAAVKAGKTRDLKPQLTDLALVLLIWAGAIYARLSLSPNKSLLILLGIIASFMFGFMIISFRKLPVTKKSHTPNKPPENSLPPLKKAWNAWKESSSIMGSFQSRILLSFFFFVFVTPIALAVRAFSDPLRIKPQSAGPSSSHWLPKKEINIDQEQYRRQF
jgi:hypothetical protein